MLKKERERLNQIDAKIRRLKGQIFVLQEERKKLLSGSQRIFKQLPVRVRNCFIRLNINNDEGIMKFFEGDCEAAKTMYFYSTAETPKERLMSLRGVGEIAANKVLNIVESNSHED